MQDAGADKLLRDLSAVADSLKRAKDTLAKGRRSVMDEAREAAKLADQYAQENVWQVIGVAGCVGLLVGVLLGLSQSSRSRRD